MLDLASIQNAVVSARPIQAQPIARVAGRTLHFDGDMLAYWAGGNKDMPASRAREILRRKVEGHMELAGAEKLVLHLTADNSLKGDRVLAGRYWPYQGNRTKMKQAKPYHHGMLRQYMVDAKGVPWKTKVWHDREADDGFGYVSAARPNDVWCTRDKDMQMLYGWHQDWDTGTLFHVPANTWWSVNPINGKIYGEAWFWLQMLMGDDADHIPGLLKHQAFPRGIGPKTAEKIITGMTPDDARQKVKDLYRESWGEAWADHFVEQAALLWIRRWKNSALDEAAYAISQNWDDMQDLELAWAKLLKQVNQAKEEANAIAHHAAASRSDS